MTITDFIEDARDELKDTEIRLSDNEKRMEAIQQSLDKDRIAVTTIRDTITKLKSLQEDTEDA